LNGAKKKQGRQPVLVSGPIMAPSSTSRRRQGSTPLVQGSVQAPTLRQGIRPGKSLDRSGGGFRLVQEIPFHGGHLNLKKLQDLVKVPAHEAVADQTSQ